MKRIHVSGIRIGRIIEDHAVFQNLTWRGDKDFPNMSNVGVVENKNGTGGIIYDNDSFGGRIKWAKYKGANPLIGKNLGELESEEVEFLTKNYPELYEEIKNLDA